METRDPRRFSRTQALRSDSKQDFGDHSREEIISLAIRWKLEGDSDAEILRRLSAIGPRLERRALARLLEEAWSRGLLRYHPSRLHDLEEDLRVSLRQHDRGLGYLAIPQSASAEDIAAAAADRVCDVIREHFSADVADGNAPRTMHIGWFGGRTPGLLAHELALRLREADRWLGQERWFIRLDKRRATKRTKDAGPARRIVFHALVGDLNPDAPEVDPNGFFVHLASAAAAIRPFFELTFSGFPSPAVLLDREYQMLRDPSQTLAMIKPKLDTFASGGIELLNLVICSGGHWGEGHFALVDNLNTACVGNPVLHAAWSRTRAALEQHDPIGDLAWQPINRHGIVAFQPPAEAEPDRQGIRVHTLLGISDLIRFAAAGGGRRVLLTLGPCFGCRTDKGELAKSILTMSAGLPITDLVIDSRSAMRCLDLLASEA